MAKLEDAIPTVLKDLSAAEEAIVWTAPMSVPSCAVPLNARLVGANPARTWGNRLDFVSVRSDRIAAKAAAILAADVAFAAE